MTDISDTLRFLKQAGVTGFDCSERALGILKAWGPSGSGRHQGPENLEAILSDLADCRSCKLSSARNHVVFGSGNPRARLVFVGEGPGYDEDRVGEPFVGKAGQLLTKIIQAIQMTRDEVYICNIVKCRPPENRNPEADEITACLPYLKRQIQAIQPDFICALGTVAAQTLLETKTPVSRLRGRFFDLEGVRVLPTYHPAFLLRNPEKKREVWEDMQLLMKTMGIDHPKEPARGPEGEAK